MPGSFCGQSKAGFGRASCKTAGRIGFEGSDCRCFVKEDINFIKRLAAERIIDVVQLHGDESQEYCRELRRKINLPVIKVLRVRNIESFESTIDYECDYLLLDTYTKTAYGGSGQRFDLEILKILNCSVRFFLLEAWMRKNVHEALEAKPYAVDVSGGVETDGSKDFEKCVRLLPQ